MRGIHTTNVGLIMIVAFLAAADSASAYYMPRIGRFLNRDPISEPGAAILEAAAETAQFIPRDPQSEPRPFDADIVVPPDDGRNTYAAMLNNTINAIDPDGRCAARSGGRRCITEGYYCSPSSKDGPTELLGPFPENVSWCLLDCHYLHEQRHKIQLDAPCRQAQRDYAACDKLSGKSRLNCYRAVKDAWDAYYRDPCVKARQECEAYSESVDCLQKKLDDPECDACEIYGILFDHIPWGPDETEMFKPRAVIQMHNDMCDEAVKCTPQVGSYVTPPEVPKG